MSPYFASSVVPASIYNRAYCHRKLVCSTNCARERAAKMLRFTVIRSARVATRCTAIAGTRLEL
jgi:hypothetical protein